MKPWCIVLPGFLLAFLAAAPLHAQSPSDTRERTLAPPTSRPDTRILSSEDVLYPHRPSIDGSFVLYSFQRYDDIEAVLDAMQSLPGSEELLLNAARAGERDVQPLPPDYGVASFGIPSIARGSRGKHSTLYLIAHGVLSMALQFGYAYLREKSKSMNSSDLDALHLPGGPGLFRDMGAVMDESMLRSDVSTMQIWKDLRYRERLRRNREAKREDVVQ